MLLRIWPISVRLSSPGAQSLVMRLRFLNDGMDQSGCRSLTSISGTMCGALEYRKYMSQQMIDLLHARGPSSTISMGPMTTTKFGVFLDGI